MQTATDTLIIGNQGLVGAVIRRYFPYTADYEEMHAAGVVGLAEAAATYDPSLGVQFATHAWWAIVNAVRAALPPRLPVRERAAPVDVTRRDAHALARALRRLPRRWSTVVAKRLQGHTLAAIGRDLGVSEGMVRKLEARAVEALRQLVEEAPEGRAKVFGACWHDARPREARCSGCFAPAAPRLGTRDRRVRELVGSLFAEAANPPARCRSSRRKAEADGAP